VQQRPMSRRSTRLDDSAPWSGGTSILRDPGVLCTSGFGVRDLATDSPYLITAGHCGELGAVWMDRTGEVIGTTVRRNTDHDDEVVATGAAGNKVYVGGPTDGVQATVAGWTEVFPGQLLCQSGNTSAEAIGGPVCNLEVQFHYTDREDLVEATQLDGQESARGGDSGGPVYAVTAQGTLLAAGTTTRSAGPGFGFQDFATYRDDFGDLVPVTEGVSGTCRVSYQITDSWPGGYAVNVTVYNSGADITGWQLVWSLPASGQIQGHWNALFAQNGPTVTAGNESYNARIASGGAVTFGFTASGSPAVPAPITLNGTPCS
jgi:cellulose binding protein with CBM2 domain